MNLYKVQNNNGRKFKEKNNKWNALAIFAEDQRATY